MSGGGAMGGGVPGGGVAGGGKRHVSHTVVGNVALDPEMTVWKGRQPSPTAVHSCCRLAEDTRLGLAWVQLGCPETEAEAYQLDTPLAVWPRSWEPPAGTVTVRTHSTRPVWDTELYELHVAK